MKTAKWLGTNLIAICGLFLLSELAVRILVPEITTQGTDKSIVADRLYDASPGLQPLSSGRSNGAAVKVDECGFRETSIPFDSTKSSWLFLGDSVTFGIGVEADSTFAGIAQSKLHSINVLNPSAIGYNINNYCDLFHYFVLDTHHDLKIERVSMFWCLNDIYATMQDFETPGGKLRYLFSDALTFLRVHSRLYFFVKTWLLDRPKSYFLFDRTFYAEGHPDFKNALERIVEINDVCRDWKIDFNLVLLPYEYQLRQPAPENLVPQKLMLAELQRRDIQVFDPFAGFNQRSDSKKYFLYGDGIHLSNCGHRFVAEFLLKQDEVLQF